MEATRSLETWRIKVEHDKIDVFKASIEVLETTPNQWFVGCNKETEEETQEATA